MCDEEEESSKQDHKATHSNGSVPGNENENVIENVNANANTNANVNAVFFSSKVTVSDKVIKRAVLGHGTAKNI